MAAKTPIFCNTARMQNLFLQRALELAQSRRGFCAPNPAVGCVIVKNNRVIGEGLHLACGKPHAEVDALQKLGERAEGADLYVTLEPCCHWGRTPPCTQAIVEAKITRVFYAFRDPNPKVAGQGEATLKQAGIACEKLSSQAIDDFYESYAYWTKHKMPFVTAKLAVSLDGKIAGVDGKPVEISGKEAKIFTFENRLHTDAILTTITTVQNDDPQLNIRFANETIRKPIYLLDSFLRFRFASKIMRTAQRLTIFHQKKTFKAKKDTLQRNDVRIIPVRKNDFGLNLTDVLKQIGEDGVHDLWVEAGAKCFNALWEQGLINRAYLYYSSQKIGPGIDAFVKPLDLQGHRLTMSKLGPDQLLRIDSVLP